MLILLIYLGRKSRYCHMLLALYVLSFVLGNLHLFVQLGLKSFLVNQIHHQIHHLCSCLLFHLCYYILYSVDIFFVLVHLIYLQKIVVVVLFRIYHLFLHLLLHNKVLLLLLHILMLLNYISLLIVLKLHIQNLFCTYILICRIYLVGLKVMVCQMELLLICLFHLFHILCIINHILIP